MSLGQETERSITGITLGTIVFLSQVLHWWRRRFVIHLYDCFLLGKDSSKTVGREVCVISTQSMSVSPIVFLLSQWRIQQSLVISHAGVIKQILAIVCQMPKQSATHLNVFHLPYAGLVTLDVYIDEQGKTWPKIVF